MNATHWKFILQWNKKEKHKKNIPRIHQILKISFGGGIFFADKF